MDIFVTCIYKYIWQLLHCLVSLYEFCSWLRLRIISFALWSYDQCRSTIQRERDDYNFLQKCKAHLNKIPKHLNLIIGPQNTQATDELLTRIFSYALEMNIECVSYYDTRYTNILNSSKYPVTALEKLKCPKGWKRKNINAHHSVWYTCKDETLNGSKQKMNGINEVNNISKSTSINGNLLNTSLSPDVASNCLEIYEIQPQNNRPLLAAICQDLFKLRHTLEIQNLLKERTILTNRLSKELSHHLGNLTEPELSIIFNDDICTFGMLPWHTRFTEFHLHVNGKHFNVRTFAHIICKYSRCEQRWGK